MEDALSALSEAAAAAAAMPAVDDAVESSHQQAGEVLPTPTEAAAAGDKSSSEPGFSSEEHNEEQHDSSSIYQGSSSSSSMKTFTSSTTLHSNRPSSATPLQQRGPGSSTAAIVLPAAAAGVVATATSELQDLASNTSQRSPSYKMDEDQHHNPTLNSIASDSVSSGPRNSSSSATTNGAPPASLKQARSPEEIYYGRGEGHSGSNGSLKRPFSRVDVLLEAAASPQAPSPAKQTKAKKTAKSDSGAPGPSTSTPSKDAHSVQHTITSSALSSASSSTMSNSTANPPTRKSAYQGPKISMACFSCRSSKTRCSGAQPCNRCELKRMECHYPLRDGRTANRTSLQTLSAVSSMTPPQSSTPSILPAILPHNNGYEPGPMQRFNQVFAYSNSSSPIVYRNPNSSTSTATATQSTPSVFSHQIPPLPSSSLSSRPPYAPISTHHQFPKLSSQQSQQPPAQQQKSPSSQDAESPAYRPSTGGSTTSRTHTSLPLNGNATKTASRSPDQFHYYPSIDRTDRLTASHPGSGIAKHERPMTTGGHNAYMKAFNVKEEEERHAQGGRDRSHSFPYPVPQHLRDYVPGLLPPPISGTSSTSPNLGSRRIGEGYDSDRFSEASMKMRDSNALHLKDHRRPMNAHPEASAFGESEPVYKPEPRDQQQHQGLPYPSSSAYLPFSFGACQHRYSPHPPTISPHHMRQNGYASGNTSASASIKSVVKQESEGASPEMDELSESPAGFGRSADLTDAISDMERSSRTSPPSTAGTSLSMSLQSASMPGSKADTPHSGSNVVGPAYLHRHNVLPSMMGSKDLPDGLFPWRELLVQAGIPDLETLKSEIPFEAVKRYVDCLAESWPEILPTFTKRFQLRYAIEDALMRACGDAPMPAIEQVA